MSVTLVAIPVIKDARKFHLEKGRRWTVIEHILLEALAKKDWSIPDLTKESSLPRRVVIESVIRLMRAGWLELKVSPSGVLFASTPTGRVYATRDELPPVTRAASRYVGYLVELFSGTVFRARDLVTLNHDQWLTRRSGRAWAELEEHLGHNQALPDIQILADRLLEPDEHLARVDVQDWRPRRLVGLVSVRDGEIEGLGGDVPDGLRAEILRCAGSSVKFPVATPLAQPRQSFNNRQKRLEHAISFRADDLVLGGEAHAQAISSALSRARHRVVLHSTFIDADRADAVLGMLRQPLEKGALIDILWGQTRERNNVNRTRDAALALQARLVREGIQDRIRVHMTATRSHSKLIVYDTGDAEHFQALVGSCNWLSSDFLAFDASVRLRENALVADLAFDLAELARPPDGQITDFSVEMLRLGKQLENNVRLSSGRASARIVTAQEHADVLADARDEACSRVMILSHRLDVAAKPAIRAVAASTQRGSSVRAQAWYGRLGDKISPAEGASVEEWARTLGVNVAASQVKLHAKVLAWDANNVLVTSLNLLSADPGEADPRQELGVLIRAPEAGRLVMSAVDKLQGIMPSAMESSDV